MRIEHNRGTSANVSHVTRAEDVCATEPSFCKGGMISDENSWRYDPNRTLRDGAGFGVVMVGLDLHFLNCVIRDA